MTMLSTLRKLSFVAIGIVLIMFMLLVSCRNSIRNYTIGIIVGENESNNIILNGFKDGMSQLGYVEGGNIKYLFKPLSTEQNNDITFINIQIRELLDRKVDLLLVIGGNALSQAKELTAGTDLPVVFAGSTLPVQEGLVESISHPGGNLTGVKFANCIPKAFEWLVLITGAQKVYVPYEPSDPVSILTLPFVEDSAAQLEVELLPGIVHSVQEAVSEIENLPGDIDAVFRIPSSLLDPNNSVLSQAAIKRRIPMVSPVILDKAVLASFKNDQHDVGVKMAHIVQQLEKGKKPADLPVETGEVTLTINLKTADAIGLSIPNEILAQASEIIR